MRFGDTAVRANCNDTAVVFTPLQLHINRRAFHWSERRTRSGRRVPFLQVVIARFRQCGHGTYTPQGPLASVEKINHKQNNKVEKCRNRMQTQVTVFFFGQYDYRIKQRYNIFNLGNFGPFCLQSRDTGANVRILMLSRTLNMMTSNRSY